LRENSLAKRYAKGLIKTIKDEKEYTSVKKELESFLEILKNNVELKAGLETLLFTKKQKKEMLNEINKKVMFHEKAFKFLMILIEENRMIFLDVIIQLLEELWFERNGVEKLKVLSAVKLSKNMEQKLIKNLEKSFNKKIVLEKEIDKSLIAGIKIQKGSIFYDFSIEGNLSKLKNALLEES
jgi:F-type H+-transporting ATPase subunit delta